MTSQPDRGPVSRATAAGRAYLALRAAAKTDGRSLDEYLKLYVLESFLARLAASPRAADLVRKGGVLMAAFALRRPTVDVDLAARNQSNDVEIISALVTKIAASALDARSQDGLVFESPAVKAESIREGDKYSGVRVTLAAQLATARVRFHVDVNVGDPISPPPTMVKLPRLLGGDITLLGYPLKMVLAEKVVTARQRGVASTRWRDFADIYLLTGLHELVAGPCRTAILTVACHRDVGLSALSVELEGYGAIGQSRYSRWRERQHLDDRLPTAFAEVVDAAIAYADPLLDRELLDDLVWTPRNRRWRPVNPSPGVLARQHRARGDHQDRQQVVAYPSSITRVDQGNHDLCQRGHRRQAPLLQHRRQRVELRATQRSQGCGDGGQILLAARLQQQVGQVGWVISGVRQPQLVGDRDGSRRCHGGYVPSVSGLA